MNIQGWFPLEWTGWISLKSKGLSRVFSSTTAQKHQFFGTQFLDGPTLTLKTISGKAGMWAGGGHLQKKGCEEEDWKVEWAVTGSGIHTANPLTWTGYRTGRSQPEAPGFRLRCGRMDFFFSFFTLGDLAEMAPAYPYSKPNKIQLSSSDGVHVQPCRGTEINVHWFLS